MIRIRLALFLPLLHLLLFCSQQAYGEVNGSVEKTSPPPPPLVLIGDLREVFVGAEPIPEITAHNKKNDPKNMSEFFSIIKKDLGQAGNKLDKFSKELSGKRRPTFQDPEFTPPKRPDWR
jgi:hypothetical protein